MGSMAAYSMFAVPSMGHVQRIVLFRGSQCRYVLQPPIPAFFAPAKRPAGALQCGSRQTVYCIRWLTVPVRRPRLVRQHASGTVTIAVSYSHS